MPLASLLGPERPSTLRAVRELLDHARRDGVTWFPSPIDWRDEVLYFLLPDRFSDGQEHTRPLLARSAIRTLRQAPSRPDIDWRQWAASGAKWQGGTINGIRGKLEYLHGLGVSTLWIGPVFKQRAALDTYHGYGIQDFLDVDPHFGTRADLQELVKAAHARGIRVILDIIVNHTGDNWGYVPPGAPLVEARNEPPYRHWPGFYGAGDGWRMAWRDEQERGFTSNSRDITKPDQGVWPVELREERLYTRAGMGDLGAGDIGDPRAEAKRTDFFSLKDLALDAPGALSFLTDCYKYWIAITDCDGFRIDTVKHMALEDTRNFCGAIREFADTLGKRNFLLVGEIAGGDFFQDFVLDRLALLQRNLSAALDIGSGRMILNAIAKGRQAGADYFREFNEASAGFESHRAFGNRHVSILDDHDHVFGAKLRFSADIPDSSPVKDHHAAAATAIQLLTLGIPCIYYGTEQAMAGPAHSQVPFVAGEDYGSNDRFLREAMFGPANGFAAFGAPGRHCFDTESPGYRRIAAICAARAKYPVLRLGRQYVRQIRLPGTGFDFPPPGELIAWSRLLDNIEALCVVNPNMDSFRGGDVVVAAELSRPGDEFVVVASTGGSAAAGTRVTVNSAGAVYVEIRDLPPGEVLVLLNAAGRAL